MTKSKRMPLLTMDEVILLVDTYFQLMDIKVPSARKELIQELSDSMRALAFYPNLKTLSNFRSYAGMVMCLANVANIDSSKTSLFGHGSVRQKKIFEYYYERKTVLHALANAIKVIGCLEFPLLPIYDESIIGKIIPSYYEYLEQNSKSIQNAKKAIMLQGKTSCSICGMNIREVYPGKEKILLEAHVTLPIAQLSGNERITLSDIIFLCPTCHKLAHSDPDFIEGKNLRESVKGR